jgi:hypothetical protein
MNCSDSGPKLLVEATIASYSFLDTFQLEWCEFWRGGGGL